ncbi:A24 family peptidase [Aestuariispira insulae]|uniref:Prepilin peptidase CpaA n=1 Tax=Aestuariispira insulae TaxID=1461337 RepID=A0A3D9HN06_9PROT|nr:prepilin peptidase [Aestuariispira insulae]RED50849.1 prepilin peptidase CpaA [Aestuariispira insulae]
MLTAITLVSLGLLALLACYAAYTDFTQYRIPNRVSLAVLFLFIPYVIAHPDPADLYLNLLVAAGVFAVGFLFFVKGWMAGGDVKLMTVVALWAGPQLVLPFLLVTSLAGGFFAILMYGHTRFGLSLAVGRLGLNRLQAILLNTKIPYGIAICFGTFFVVWQLVSQVP